jgi:protein SCO1
MPRWLVIAVVAMAMLAVASAIMLVLRRPVPNSGPIGVGARGPVTGVEDDGRGPPYPRVEDRTALTPDRVVWGWPAIPAFRLTDQDGKEQTDAILDGRVTVIDFIFTNCPYACPGMTAEMATAAAALKDTPVRFVSFAVDPERDTPERLRAFAAEHGADPSQWTFLTGPLETTRKIANETLQFELRPDAARPIELADGTTINNVVHPTKLLLVGPDRRLIAMYEYSLPEDMLALVARARAAAAELGKK